MIWQISYNLLYIMQVITKENTSACVCRSPTDKDSAGKDYRGSAISAKKKKPDSIHKTTD